MFPDSGAIAPASGLRAYKDTSAKRPRPASLPEQAAAVAARFNGKGGWKKRLPQLLETLVALGRARRFGERYLTE